MGATPECGDDRSSHARLPAIICQLRAFVKLGVRQEALRRGSQGLSPYRDAPPLQGSAAEAGLQRIQSLAVTAFALLLLPARPGIDPRLSEGSLRIGRRVHEGVYADLRAIRCCSGEGDEGAVRLLVCPGVR